MSRTRNEKKFKISLQNKIKYDKLFLVIKLEVETLFLTFPSIYLDFGLIFQIEIE